eukprot:83309-Amphidinium_carterae.1
MFGMIASWIEPSCLVIPQEKPCVNNYVGDARGDPAAAMSAVCTDEVVYVLAAKSAKRHVCVMSPSTTHTTST